MFSLDKNEVFDCETTKGSGEMTDKFFLGQHCRQKQFHSRIHLPKLFVRLAIVILSSIAQSLLVFVNRISRFEFIGG